MYNTINWKDYPSESTPITAQSLNHMDLQIKANSDDIEILKQDIELELTGILLKGQTQLVFTSPDFTQNSEIRFLTKPYGYFPTDITEDLSNNRIITNWRKSDDDVSVKLKFKP